MGGVDALDAGVSVYRIHVRGKNGIGPIINTIDILKSAAFKMFWLANPDEKMDFLPFCKKNCYALFKSRGNNEGNQTKYSVPCKSWKGNSEVAGNERVGIQHFIEKTL